MKESFARFGGLFFDYKKCIKFNNTEASFAALAYY
jgi:hypothetical protein